MYAPLTDSQWERVGRMFYRQPPKPRRKSDRRGGRPRILDRVCFDALLWTLFNPRAEELPKTLCSARTLRSRIRQWKRDGCFFHAWRAYLSTLSDESLREHCAALGRHWGYFRWRSDMHYFLSTEYGPRLAAAAKPPTTDRKLDPELEELFAKST